MLLRGEAGWGEWSPFLEYEPAVAEPWLRCAEEAAAGDWPAPVRDVVPVNVTVPAVGPEQAHKIVSDGGCATAKVKVAEPGPVAGRRPGAGGGGARRAGPVGPAAGRRERRVVGRRRGARDRLAGQGRGWARVRRAALRDGRGAGGGAPRGRRTDRGRRVDPAGLGPLPASATSRPPTSRCSRCSRSAACAPACGSRRRSACRSSCRRRWRPRSGSRPGWRWPGRCPSLPYACGLATVQLLTADVVADPLLPVDGVAAGPAADGRPARAGPAGGHRPTGSRTGRRGWPRCGPVTDLVSATEVARSVVSALVDVRCPRGRAGAGVAERAALLRGLRRGRGRAAAAAHPDRRADRRLPRARADQGRLPGRGDVHVRDRGREPAPGGAGGTPRRACRWWSSPPTGRPACAAPTPTRPPTRSGSSARR